MPFLLPSFVLDYGHTTHRTHTTHYCQLQRRSHDACNQIPRPCVSTPPRAITFWTLRRCRTPPAPPPPPSHLDRLTWLHCGDVNMWTSTFAPPQMCLRAGAATLPAWVPPSPTPYTQVYSRLPYLVGLLQEDCILNILHGHAMHSFGLAFLLYHFSYTCSPLNRVWTTGRLPLYCPRVGYAAAGGSTFGCLPAASASTTV